LAATARPDRMGLFSKRPKAPSSSAEDDADSPAARLRNLGYTATAAEVKHPKKKEDRHALLSFETEITRELCTIALIADGHNGPQASDLAERYLLPAIAGQL